jgi:hypothetical protein
LKQATSGNARLLSLSGKINPYTEGKLGITVFKGSKITGKLIGYTFGSIIIIGILYSFINH